MRQLSFGLALAMLDGSWELHSLQARCELALGRRPAWLEALCVRAIARFPEAPSEVDPLFGFLKEDTGLYQALWKDPARIRRWFYSANRMAEIGGPPSAFRVPAIANQGELARTLQLDPNELAWFADITRRNAAATASEALRHYRYRWVRKRSGGARLLETPKPHLKALQHWVLRNILEACACHPAAHGFVARHSVFSFVAPHVAQRVVLRLDLEDFFACISGARVRAIFRRLGYPLPVAQMLGGLCSTPTPSHVLALAPLTNSNEERFETARRLRGAHLAQGAPTSPALSNLACVRLDQRLAGLAQKAGARYSRYADDLAFSGDRDFERGLSGFIACVAAIVLDEGFRVRYRKTRVMRAGTRQSLAGLVLNQKPNLLRRDYDRLRALLHNAARSGPAAQNRAGHTDFRAHLRGRIDWIASHNPKRGARLRALFERIDWS